MSEEDGYEEEDEAGWKDYLAFFGIVIFVLLFGPFIYDGLFGDDEDAVEVAEVPENTKYIAPAEAAYQPPPPPSNPGRLWPDTDDYIWTAPGDDDVLGNKEDWWWFVVCWGDVPSGDWPSVVVTKPFFYPVAVRIIERPKIEERAALELRSSMVRDPSCSAYSRQSESELNRMQEKEWNHFFENVDTSYLGSEFWSYEEPYVEQNWWQAYCMPTSGEYHYADGVSDVFFLKGPGTYQAHHDALKWSHEAFLLRRTGQQFSCDLRWSSTEAEANNARQNLLNLGADTFEYLWTIGSDEFES